MSELKALIAKLNPICKRALELAAALCVAQTHYNVEIEHFLVKLIEMPGCDIGPVLRYYDVHEAEVTKELGKAIERFDRGNSRTPAMSPQIVRLLREGWIASTLMLLMIGAKSAAAC